MKKNVLPGLLAAGVLAMLLTGCGNIKAYLPNHTEPVSTATRPVPAPTAPTTVSATVPPDGSPNDVTCKGSYTGQPDSTAAARIGDSVLTNEQLSAYYWAEVAQYCGSGQTPAPDLERPLDTQSCDIDGSVASWQQFFLRRALNTWHSAQALILQGEEEGLPVEEAYQPNLENYKLYMTDQPATKFLYRYQKAFQPNTMHQAYLDAIPENLETLAAQKGYDSAEAMAREAFGISLEVLEAFVESYNRGYMYFTNLSYFIELTDQDVEETMAELDGEGALEDGTCVDLRHILLIPGEEGDSVTIGSDGSVTCSEELWVACEEKAQALMEEWARPKNTPSEATFADLAVKHSRDGGTALDGGAYHQIRKGQLIETLDSWCFAEDRESGDTAVIRSDYGVHILYYCGARFLSQIQAENAAREGKQADILGVARGVYPMEVSYSDIVLSEGAGTVSLADVLYPDIAHERFPEIPLYLQQDYPNTMYGGFPIRTNGCGITTMAMVASYFADDELTPPEMCAKYGRYSFVNGTDGSIFQKEPATMGFYLREKTYEYSIAMDALKEGQIVVCLEQKGYWTRGGHYIAIEKVFDDGMVQVRDSNIYNYGKLAAHKEDRHTWRSILSGVSGFWIFEDKVTAIPACSRCGTDGDHTRDFLEQPYICHKCAAAMLRRNTYLTTCGE